MFLHFSLFFCISFSIFFKAAFLWGDLDQDQWSKICLDHDLSEEPMNTLWSWIRRFLWCTMIPTDLESLIWIQITSKERTLSCSPSHQSLWELHSFPALTHAQHLQLLQYTVGNNLRFCLLPTLMYHCSTRQSNIQLWHQHFFHKLCTNNNVCI